MTCTTITVHTLQPCDFTLQYNIVQYNSIHFDIPIYCVEQYIALYCSILCVLCEPELDHWNVNVDKLLFLRENLRQLTFLYF